MRAMRASRRSAEKHDVRIGRERQRAVTVLPIDAPLTDALRFSRA